jgi:hypothetical protein
MHVSAATGVAAISEARAKGLPIYGESLHQYMLHTAEDYKLPNGQIYHTYPSLKSAEDQKALWAGTRNGAINCVATDELCCTLREKTMGRRIDDTTGGNSGVEPRLGVMYTEMVVRRGYSLRQYVDLVSTNAARIMGLYPRKGALAVGSDADIAILDRHGEEGAQGGPTRRTTRPGRADIFAWPVVTPPARLVGTGVPGPRRPASISSARSRPRSSTGRCEVPVLTIAEQAPVQLRVLPPPCGRVETGYPAGGAAAHPPNPSVSCSTCLRNDGRNPVASFMKFALK